jgi:hypothetical protein
MGIHLHHLEHAAELSDLHFSFLRLWDTHTAWSHIEPRRGAMDFSKLDGYVQLAQDHHASVILTLGQTPQWASSAPNAPGPNGPGASAPPTNIDDWRRYIGALADRYKGRIQYWELWNEVNDKKFYSGTPEQLRNLAAAAREVLKQSSQGNIVLSPSIEGGALREFREQSMGGILKSCDIVSYHFYAPHGTPETAYDRMGKVRDILKEAGYPDMPLWDTEVGWLNATALQASRSNVPQWAQGWRQLSELELGGFILRMAILNRAAGIPVLVWYSWDNGVMGLGGGTGSHGSRVAVDAFNFAAENVMNANTASVVQQGGLWHATIQGKGQTLDCFWRVDGESQFDAPSGAALVFPPPSDLPRNAAGERPTVGSMPLVFRRQG